MMKHILILLLLMVTSCQQRDKVHASMAKGQSVTSDPLIVSENSVEDGYLKNRDFWAPFDSHSSLFTNPKSHVKDNYLYIVHAPSSTSFEHPDSLKDLLISASLINQNHNKTFGGTDKGVFVLKVPKNLIFATNPVDIGLDNRAIFPVSLEGSGLNPGMSLAEVKARLLQTSCVTEQDLADISSIVKYGNRLRIELRAKFKKHGIHHPSKVMEKAAIRRLGPHAVSNGHTEIVVLGKNESEAVEVAGVLFVNYSALKGLASDTRRLSPLFSSFLTLHCHVHDLLSLALS